MANPNPNPNKPRDKTQWYKKPLAPIRKAIKKDTIGGIVFRRTQKGVEILLIQDSKDRWTIPKGKNEGDERQQATLKREIREETGLKDVRIMDWLGKTHFNYRFREALLMMTAHLYLVEATGETDKIRPEKSEGIKAVKWFPSAEAIDLIEYENMSRLLLLALKKIRDYGNAR